MLRSVAILAGCLWLVPLDGAAAGTDPPANAESPDANADPAGTNQETPVVRADLALARAGADFHSAAPPSEQYETQPVKQVAIDPTAKPPVCRRYFPTGSRIATERCQSAEVKDGAARNAEREQTRRDIDEMRMRQMAREQARAAAQADALRQRAGL